MYNQRYLQHRFIAEMLCFSLFGIFSSIATFHILLNLPTIQSSLLTCTLVYFGVRILYIDRFKNETNAIFILLLIATLIYFILPLTAYLDLIIKISNPGRTKEITLYKEFSFLYSLFTIITATVLSYLNARNKSKFLSVEREHEIEWWLLTIYPLHLKFHAHTSNPTPTKIYWLLGLTGIVTLYFFTIHEITIPFDRQELRYLMMRLITVMMILILGCHFGIHLGETIRLLQLEKELGRGPFRPLHFEDRLEWRHDYVKYAMPKFLCKLFPRFCEKHIKAYEHYVSVIKTRKGKDPGLTDWDWYERHQIQVFQNGDKI